MQNTQAISPLLGGQVRLSVIDLRLLCRLYAMQYNLEEE